MSYELNEAIDLLYDIGFLIFSLFYLPTLIFKGKMHSDFGERFGRYSEDKRKALIASKGAIWIQAVSVGEVAACAGLVKKLKGRFPGKRIILSTITKTGNDLAIKLYKDEAVIIYFPLDLSWIVKRVVSLFEPSLYIMVETEIWPNTIKEISRRGVPSAIVNGRISDRSFGKYKFAKPFLSGTLKSIGIFCMQSLQDVERIISLGAPKEKVRLTGNMKFDVEVSSDPVKSAELKKLLGMGESDMLLIAGSTHPGEEAIVLDAFKRLIPKFPGLKLLVAPRHVERSRDVEAAVRSFGFEPVMLSAVRGQTGDHRGRGVFILDTIGRLKELYSISSVVFMGGSMIPHGGQNPIEPAALGKPVIFGPHMFNFKEITATLIDSDAAFLVKEADGLFGCLDVLLADPARRLEVAKHAGAAIAQKRGATDRIIEEICGIFSVHS